MPVGHYISPVIPETRSRLALPDSSPMENVATLQIPAGAEYFESQAVLNFGDPGWARQIYVPEVSILKEF